MKNSVPTTRWREHAQEEKINAKTVLVNVSPGATLHLHLEGDARVKVDAAGGTVYVHQDTPEDEDDVGEDDEEDGADERAEILARSVRCDCDACLAVMKGG
jgi:hypothetical protein